MNYIANYICVNFRKSKPGLIILLIAILLSSMLTTSCSNQKRLYTVGIIQLIDDPSLDKGRLGVIAALNSAGYEDGKNITIDYKNAQGDLSNINQIFDSFISNGVDLIITVSTPCMVGASTKIKDIPVVFTVAFSPEQMGVNPVPKNLTGAYDPFDLGETLAMIKQLVPNVTRIGLPYNPGEPNAVFAMKRMKDECQKAGIELVTVTVNSTADLEQSARSLISSGIDLFIVSADNTTYSAMPLLAKIATQNKKSVFVTDPAVVEAGATVGYGNDYYTWGVESGKIAVEIIKGGKVENLPIKTLKNKQLFINKKAAAEQGLDIPDDILKKATIVEN